MAPKISFF